MFLPLGFEHWYERRPWVTAALVAANVLVTVLTWGASDGEIRPYMLDPGDFRIHQLVTSSFLHAGLLHLAGNLLFLWVFGRYVEDRLGAWRFAALYFASGLFGDLAYLASGADLPSLGASGGISGLMGYVLVAAPWLEMRLTFTVGFYVVPPFEAPVGLLLVPWAIMQLLMGPGSGVAVVSHLGGFAFGAGAAAVMRSRYCEGTGWYIDPRPPQGGKAAVERLRRARAAGIRRS